MYQIDFTKPQSVHFVGIGGISMSGLAEILMDEGFKISGSDAHESELTRHLEAKGAVVYYGQKAENIKDGIDAVVYTAAIHEDNPEFMEVKRRGIPMMSRAELLGQMMKNYREAIAIAGTHGKTTTTSMVTEIFLEADNNPTISVGGILNSIGGNIRVGGPEFFVTEACEYTNSFLSFYPTMAVILNIEEDHLDFFRDLDDIRSSFRCFAQLLPEDGLLIISGDISDYEEITRGLSCSVLTFGSDSSCDYYYDGISHDEFAHASFTLHRRGGSDIPVSLGVPGEHNILNALAALALADYLKLDMETAARALKNFTGTDRRFEYKGSVEGITIVDDYAHHPTEITATLKAARNYPHQTLWCVFQPHTYTRTKAFLPEFAQALSLADKVILADIYPARETDTLGISSRSLQEIIVNSGTECHYFPSFEEIQKFILENCTPGDLLITMGAGDVVNIGENLLKQ